MDSDSIAQIFSSSGPFARAFPGYQPRQGQIELAEAVRDALKDGCVLMGEAGTGVGKSFGALVPAIRHVKAKGGKVIVVTANIALQEQYARKDLPTLQRILGINFTFALAKGFANYLCRERMDTAETEYRVMKTKRLPVLQEQRTLEEVLDWQTETGDLSDFPTELPPAVKKLVTTPSEDCIGKKCEHFLTGCFPRNARRAFGAADVIVTNYHLYFLDLEMKMRGAPGVLPEHDAVIFDEAHEMAEIARSFLGLRATRAGVRAACEELDAQGRRAERLGLPKKVDTALKSKVESEADAFFAELLTTRRNPKLYRARINRKGIVAGHTLEASLRKVAEVYVRTAALNELEAEARDWLRGRASLCARYAELIKGARELGDDEQIFYIDDENGRAALVREPLFPAKILKEHLFESPEPPRGIVLMSATLTTSSKKDPFGYTAKQVGIDKRDEVIAESPFDFSKCTFIVPRGLPDPKDEEFAGSVGEVLIDTVRAARGRTLGLFTSYRVMDVAYQRLVEAGLGYTILRQKDAPRSQLIKRFKEEPESVLLGTESFWTGVDVPGEALLAVVMDKIPFDHFDDPVLDAIKMKDEDNWFYNYYLPKAVIRFKQGFGRLIRSLDDRGVVVCCDKRITTKSYGKNFKNAAPLDCDFSERLADVTAACWPTTPALRVVGR